jgi:branched-chain amino acid transport system substrate-binding protein
MKAPTKVSATVLVVLTVLVAAGYFAYTEYHRAQVLAQIRPAVKNASIRISQNLEIELRPSHITYKEFFEKTEASIAELDKKAIELRSLEAGTGQDAIDSATTYLANGQELLRVQLQKARADLALSSAFDTWQRHLSEARLDSGYGRSLGYRFASRSNEEVQKARADVEEKGAQFTDALRNFSDVLQKTAEVLPISILVDPKVLKELLASKEPQKANTFNVPDTASKEQQTANNSNAPQAVSSIPTIRIGLASPLSGPQQQIGIDIKHGAELAVAEVNEAGLTINGQNIKVELVSEDDGAQPVRAAVVAQKLVDSKVVAVVGHFNSGASIPASRIYWDAGIPQISPSSTNPKYTQQGFETAFRIVAHDDRQGPIIARFALDHLKVKAIAVIDDGTAYGEGLADAFEKVARAGGATIVARKRTTDTETDFRAILTEIKARNPDLIMFGGIDPQAGPMVRQMSRLGIRAKFIGGDGIQTPNFIKLAGPAAEGVMASMPGLPKENMPGSESFLKKFKVKFNTEVELFAPMGYDAVMVFIDAMKRAGSTNPAKFLPEVQKTNYQGVIGPIEFDARGDLKNAPTSVYVVRGGRWEPFVTLTAD